MPRTSRNPKFTKSRGKPTRVIAKKALTIAKMSLGELKHHDVDIIAGGQSSTATIARLSTPAIATTLSSDDVRDGNVVLSKSLFLYGRVDSNVSSSSTTFRLIVFIDKQNNGVAPGVGDILDGSSTIDDFNPVFLADLRKRFTILLDRRWRLTNDVDANTASGKILINFKKKLSGKQYFAGVADNDAAAGRNSIWSLTISNEASNTPVAVISSRYVYQDI